MLNKRSPSPTIRCNWCFNINSGGRWLAERRHRSTEEYLDVVCAKCKTFFFGDHDIAKTIKEIKDWQA